MHCDMLKIQDGVGIVEKLNWSCGSEVVLTSVLTDYSEGIRPVSGQLYRRSFAILARTLHAKECKSN